jgi:hypothetical protein
MHGEIMETKGWYNGYSWQERQAKLLALKRRISRGEQPPATGPCNLCGDPDVPVEYHDEDYSLPYLWGPPALLALCRNCHRDKLHKRFARPFAWQACLAHVRRGGYARDLKTPELKAEVMRLQAALERGEEAHLGPLRSYPHTPGTEWFARLSVDPATLSSPSARPRP